ncbi:hypothetical protein C3495_07385 [Clostridiaceae bacterium 14S0207]|nr:hypothetical protein C3495_07385 [Clostridiaceae bacterium 14S0207]
MEKLPRLTGRELVILANIAALIIAEDKQNDDLRIIGNFLALTGSNVLAILSINLGANINAEQGPIP